MPHHWRLFNDVGNPTSTAQGLAVDDTLPQSVESHKSPPILHLYTFMPSAIVGKYQDINAALKLDRCKELGLEYNRRSTGGGTVIMGPEIVALGLGINAAYKGLKRGVGGIFETLGRVLIRALGMIGIEAQFRPKNDLEVGGKKIAGLSAALEKGNSLLFHTSLLVDFDVGLMTEIMNTPLVKLQDKGYNCFSQRMTTVRSELARNVSVQEVMTAIVDAFEEKFQVRMKPDTPDEWESEMIGHYITNRYKNPKWIFSHKHPRAQMGIGRLKTRAGLLEIYVSMSGGSIENLVITGDFFSTTDDIQQLENVLKWTSAHQESIQDNLSSVWRKDMIHGLEIPDLTRAILRAKDNQAAL
jgi:lipoate-protein ligase A